MPGIIIPCIHTFSPELIDNNGGYNEGRCVYRGMGCRGVNTSAMIGKDFISNWVIGISGQPPNQI